MAKLNWERAAKLCGRRVLDHRFENEIPDRAARWIAAVERRHPQQRITTTASSSYPVGGARLILLLFISGSRALRPDTRNFRRLAGKTARTIPKTDVSVLKTDTSLAGSVYGSTRRSSTTKSTL